MTGHRVFLWKNQEKFSKRVCECGKIVNISGNGGVKQKGKTKFANPPLSFGLIEQV